MPEYRAELPEIGAFSSVQMRAFTGMLLAIAAIGYVVYDPQGFLKSIVATVVSSSGLPALPYAGHIWKLLISIAVIALLVSSFGSVLSSVPGGDSKLANALRYASFVTWAALGACNLVGLYCDFTWYGACALVLVLLACFAIQDGLRLPFLLRATPFFVIAETFGLGWFLTYAEDAKHAFSFDGRSVVWALAMLTMQSFRVWADHKRKYQ